MTETWLLEANANSGERVWSGEDDSQFPVGGLYDADINPCLITGATLQRAIVMLVDEATAASKSVAVNRL